MRPRFRGWFTVNFFSNSVGGIVAILVVVLGFAMMYLRPETKTEIVALMMVVLQFYFGSSKGSQDKDKLISTLKKGAKDEPPAG